MIDKLLEAIPDVSVRKLVSVGILVFCGLALVATGWFLRAVEDKEIAAHESHASHDTQEQIYRDLRLLLECQRVELKR